MELQAEYKSDMHKKYMIINQEQKSQKPAYILQMLLNNRIPGLLKQEVRMVDSTARHYFDITLKQPILWGFEKGNLSESQIRNLLLKVIHIISGAGEYLLDENDFVLKPEYIYTNTEEDEISLCYMHGYQVDIRGQICSLLEYLMNKVNYREDHAVLLIYNLYKISREENYTFLQLCSLLEEKKKDTADVNPLPVEKTEEIRFESIENETLQDNIPTEEEIKVYSGESILYSIASVLITIIIFVIVAKSGLVYNRVSGGLDGMRIFGILLIGGGTEAYVLSRLLDHKRKITRIKEKKKDTAIQKHIQEPSLFHMESVRDMAGSGEPGATVVLAADAEHREVQLLSLEKQKYQDILLSEFPFFIGALKMKVDYAIDNHTISRFHAKIDRTDGQFFITDLNSTNGTFINGERLKINEKRVLQTGDEVAFANVNYRFTSL